MPHLKPWPETHATPTGPRGILLTPRGKIKTPKVPGPAGKRGAAAAGRPPGHRAGHTARPGPLPGHHPHRPPGRVRDCPPSAAPASRRRPARSRRRSRAEEPPGEREAAAAMGTEYWEMRCIKILLFIFNLTFWVSAGAAAPAAGGSGRWRMRGANPWLRGRARQAGAGWSSGPGAAPRRGRARGVRGRARGCGAKLGGCAGPAELRAGPGGAQGSGAPRAGLGLQLAICYSSPWGNTYLVQGGIAEKTTSS